MRDVVAKGEILQVLLFAVMPTFHGFLFHTITEGVTPALSLVVLCSALLAQRSGRWLWVGLATTAGTPPAVMQRLGDAARASLRTAEMQRFRDKVKPVIEKHSAKVGEDTVKEVYAEIAKVRK